MTLQLRPTFSESWYRVAGLRAKLRPSAQISRQYYRGERWYVVRDPAGNQFHRLSDPAYRFVGLLDGRRTVSEAWDLAGGQLADDAPTQPEVIQILSHLFSANLIDADVTPDATVLLRRHKQLSKRKMQGRLMNVLFPRIPLWDPDAFLVRWMPLVRTLFSKVGAVIWLIVIGIVATLLVPEGARLKAAAEHAVDLQHNPINVLYLWAVFVFIKLIHELGHAFACRRFGGECHELGIMFLVFIPTPYVDASSAWAFPSRWQRIFVGAAGMIVELFFAALCAFLWLNTSSSHIVSQLAFNAMLVASVSTVIFNANPLLRYDGYYILSDFLEIPNLRQKSTEYALGLIKRHVFRVKQQQPLPPVLQRVWLLSYAVLSSIYRVFVGVVIMLVVTYQIPVLGVLMAIGGVITWLVVPLGKTFKYLTIDPELHRKRFRAMAFAISVTAAAVALIGLIPFWFNVSATGITEPHAKEVLRAKYPGFVSEISTTDGANLRGPVLDATGKVVRPGDVILVLNDKDLERDIAQTEARLKGTRARLRQSIAMDPAQRRIDEDAVQTLENQLADYQERKELLTIRAPFDGLLISPMLHEMPGRYLPRGQDIGTIAQLDKLRVRAVLPQKDVEPVVGGTTITEVRLAGDLHTVLSGYDVQKSYASAEELPDPSLGTPGSEEIAIDPHDPTGKKPMISQFEVGITLDNPAAKYRPGQRAYVEFKLDKKPLIWQWGRRFWQLVQTRSNTKWM